MSEEQPDEIRDLLKDIKQLLILTNKQQLDKVKKELLTSGSTGEKVYNLCDGKNDSIVIGKKLTKSNKIISARISELRDKGLIRTKNVNGKYIHFKTF